MSLSELLSRLGLSTGFLEREKKKGGLRGGIDVMSCFRATEEPEYAMPIEFIGAYIFIFTSRV